MKSDTVFMYNTYDMYNYNIKYYRFSYAGTWELVNLFVRRKIFSYSICFKNIAKESRFKRQTDHEQTEVSNMLVKKMK